MQTIKITKYDKQLIKRICNESIIINNVIYKRQTLLHHKAIQTYILCVISFVCLIPALLSILVCLIPIFKHQIVLNTITYGFIISVIALCTYFINNYYASHKIIKTIVNVFDKNELNHIDKNTKTILIPIKLDATFINVNKIFIFTKNNKINKLKFLTFINRDDPNFDEKKFWQTHTTPIKEYLNGNLSTSTQKEA